MKRRKKDFYYFADGGECDFIVKDGNKIVQAIQVCYELNKENKEREINGILEALNRFKLKEGLIITLDQEEELEKENKRIKTVPVWKWLLQRV